MLLIDTGYLVGLAGKILYRPGWIIGVYCLQSALCHHRRGALFSQPLTGKAGGDALTVWKAAPPVKPQPFERKGRQTVMGVPVNLTRFEEKIQEYERYPLETGKILLYGSSFFRQLGL